ncbi:MAG: hypothetical protein GDA56_16250 [Hormoscilla sp. GM7CHS1pb]|nr:hypothetical protein [Hormoscilla sp. GM7CHS1pb]
MSQNNDNIWTFLDRFAIIVGTIAGIISATVAVLAFLETKSFQTQQRTSPEQTPSQPKSETPERPTQDYTPTRPYRLPIHPPMSLPAGERQGG